MQEHRGRRGLQGPGAVVSGGQVGGAGSGL
jgi:hypothetical protein